MNLLRNTRGTSVTLEQKLSEPNDADRERAQRRIDGYKSESTECVSVMQAIAELIVAHGLWDEEQQFATLPEVSEFNLEACTPSRPVNFRYHADGGWDMVDTGRIDGPLFGESHEHFWSTLAYIRPADFRRIMQRIEEHLGTRTAA